jgi:hypothetical protein
MDRERKRQELVELRARVSQLEAELDAELGVSSPPNWYGTYQAVGGALLGMLAALTSLLFNVAGSLIVGQHPLQLIRVYLTFPLGSRALALGEHANQLRDDVVLALGCFLYLATGIVLGVAFHLLLSRGGLRTGRVGTFLLATCLSLGLWIFNFYGVLSWVQPLLFDGDWIIRDIPWWVAAATHLVFGWTIWLLQPIAKFVPYPTHAERA